jgi:hypothetical protein
LFYKIATAFEPTKYVWGFDSAQSASGGVAAYAGIDPTGPIDGHGGSYNSATLVITAPSITATVANDQLIFFAAIATDSTVKPPAGMGQHWTATSKWTTTSFMADQLLSVVGATGDKVGSQSVEGSSNIGQLVALKPMSVNAFNLSAAGGLSLLNYDVLEGTW